MRRFLAIAIVISGTILPVFVQAQQSEVPVEQDYAFALGLFRDKNYRLALEQFDTFARSHPESTLAPDAEYYAAECLYQQGNLTDAALRFRAFQEKRPASKLADDAGFREAEVYYRQGKFDRSYAQFSSVVEKYPEGDLAHEAAYWAGESALKRDSYADALRWYRIAYDQYPNGRVRDYARFSIGYAQEKQSRYDEAIETYRGVLAEFPGSAIRPSASTRIAACLYQKQDYAGVISAIDTLTDSPDPDNAAERLYFKAEARYKLGQLAEAEQLYRSFLQAYPSHARARQVQYSLGWVCVDQKKYSDAFAVFDDLGKGNDEIAEAARFRKGMALRLNGDIEAAKQTFQGMLALNPMGAYADNAVFELGMAAFQEGSYQAALEQFRLVVDRFPESDVRPDAFHMIGESYLKLQKPEYAADAFAAVASFPDAPASLRSNAHFRQGYALVEAGKYSDAASVFESFLRVYPADSRKPDALIWLGESCLNADRLQDAAIAYNQALAVAETPQQKQEALYGLGWAQYRAGEYREAETTLRRYTVEFRGQKHDMDANARLGDALYAMKQYRDAEKTYRYAARMYPNHGLAPYVLLQLGNAEHRAGDTPAGIVTLKDALVRYPASVYADKLRFSLAWLYFASKDYDVARSGCEELIRTHPASDLAPKAAYMIGDCLYNQGKYAEAEQAYRRVISGYPTSLAVPDALDGVAQCLRMQGKNAEAEKVKSEWLAKHPNDAVSDEVVFANARKLFTDGNHAAAIPALQQFVKSRPKSARRQEALVLLGTSYRESGRFGEARNALNEAAAMDTASAHGVQARMELAQLAIDNQDWDEALGFCDILLRTPAASSRRAEIHLLGGRIHLRKHQTDEAAGDFRSARSADPGGASGDRAGIELARLDARSGAVDSALIHLTETATRRTDDVGAEAQYTIGELLLDAGRTGDAEKAYLRVGYVFGESAAWAARSLLRLGSLYEQSGRKEEALASYTKIVENYGGTDEAAEAQRKLGRGE